MLRKLSRYLFKKGISDVELLKILGILGMSAFVMGMMLYGAIEHYSYKNSMINVIILLRYK